MRLIKVIDDDESITLEVEGNTIPLAVVKTYFPNAKSLTYKIDGEKVGLNTLNDQLQLPVKITQFNVFNSSTARGNST